MNNLYVPIKEPAEEGTKKFLLFNSGCLIISSKNKADPKLLYLGLRKK